MSWKKLVLVETLAYESYQQIIVYIVNQNGYNLHMDLLGGLFTGWGAILLGVLIALTTALKWPRWLGYVWGALVLISGVLSM